MEFSNEYVSGTEINNRMVFSGELITNGTITFQNFTTTFSETGQSFRINVAPPPTPTPTPTISVTPSITPTISVTPSITPTISVTPSITPSITPTISITPSITPTISITPSITPTISVTPSTSPPPPPEYFRIGGYDGPIPEGIYESGPSEWDLEFTVKTKGTATTLDPQTELASIPEIITRFYGIPNSITATYSPDLDVNYYTGVGKTYTVTTDAPVFLKVGDTLTGLTPSYQSFKAVVTSSSSSTLETSSFTIEVTEANGTGTSQTSTISRVGVPYAVAITVGDKTWVDGMKLNETGSSTYLSIHASRNIPDVRTYFTWSSMAIGTTGTLQLEKPMIPPPSDGTTKNLVRTTFNSATGYSELKLGLQLSNYDPNTLTVDYYIVSKSPSTFNPDVVGDVWCWENGTASVSTTVPEYQIRVWFNGDFERTTFFHFGQPDYDLRETGYEVCRFARETTGNLKKLNEGLRCHVKNWDNPWEHALDYTNVNQLYDWTDAWGTQNKVEVRASLTLPGIDLSNSSISHILTENVPDIDFSNYVWNNNVKNGVEYDIMTTNISESGVNDFIAFASGFLTAGAPLMSDPNNTATFKIGSPNITSAQVTEMANLQTYGRNLGYSNYTVEQTY